LEFFGLRGVRVGEAGDVWISSGKRTHTHLDSLCLRL
jgi:hypothetical protein